MQNITPAEGKGLVIVFYLIFCYYGILCVVGWLVIEGLIFKITS